jgi:hypothetical protein
MKSHPAVRRAGILLQYGRFNRAVACLEAALSAEPDNRELLDALEHARLQRSQSRGWCRIRHQLVAWLLFPSALLLAISPLVLVARRLDSWLPARRDDNLLTLLAVIIACVMLLLPLILLGARLFLWAWFRYLALLPEVERDNAEVQLARAINVAVLEPQYSQARERFVSRNGR